MPQLPSLKPRRVIQALEHAGFTFARQRGSHRIYVKGLRGVTVPYHNKDLRRGTLASIVKQSGMTVGEFIKALKK